MNQGLTKDIVIGYLQRKSTDIMIQEKCQDIVKQISVEIQELFKSGKYSLLLNIVNSNKISISITLNEVTLEEYICSCDILYSEASLLIEIRNIKDVLYDARKNISFKSKKPLWKKLLGI
jgi:hypothetical protein